MTVSNSPRPAKNHFDALRLGFASLVLLSHAPELIDGNRSRELLTRLTGVQSFGEFAVSGFFALSGFLIMASWLRQPKPLPYFRNRILRIYPGFIVAFCVSVLVVGPIATEVKGYFDQFSKSRFVFSMLTLRDPWFAESFPSLHYRGVNSAMWTISYEFTCYVALAVIGVLARRNLKVVWLALTAVLLIGACFIPELEPLPQVNRFNIAALVRLSAIFFSGAALCIVGFRGFAQRKLLLVAAILFAATCFSRRFDVVGFAVFGSAFWISLGLSTSAIAARFRLPDISYGTYLYGWPILELLILFIPDLGPWTAFVLSLILSFIFGVLSWRIVEEPFLRLKVRTGASAAHLATRASGAG